jgi:hypothetical protein
MAELKDVHALAHTARMIVSAAATPRTGKDGAPDAEHATDIEHRRVEYDEQMTVYRMRWRRLTDEQRAEIIEATRDQGNITEDQLNAAVAAMEG